MAVKLIANYSKRLGLPGFSSHQFSVSVETELLAVADVAGESERLYELLQNSVDQQIQSTGFVPPVGYGMDPSQAVQTSNGNGHKPNGSNGQVAHSRNGDELWNCTEGQRGFILRIVEENQLEKAEVEGMAQQLFGVGVKQLDRMQASQLIDELLQKTGKNPGRNRWSKRQPSRS